jgi:hypothetical protein
LDVNEALLLLRSAQGLARWKGNRQFERRHPLASSAYSLMTPTSQRITRTIRITPTIPIPPPLFISISVQ